MGVSAASTVFLSALLLVYVRNHQHLQSVFTLGLVFFAALLLLQSLGSIYFDWMMAQSGAGSGVAMPMLALGTAELIGFAALFWVTWR
jgi:hypothetical protein